jgi:NADH-ubiquinone oxidoreductase chain 1
VFVIQYYADIERSERVSGAREFKQINLNLLFNFVMESELVAGFFTEHSSLPFVMFFLAEYSSIVLFSCLTAIFFLGGYNLFPWQGELFINNSFINLQSIILGIKTCIFCFIFVWCRATLPRLRYDQLIEMCWLSLLPVAVAFIILVPSILISFDISPY